MRMQFSKLSKGIIGAASAVITVVCLIFGYQQLSRRRAISRWNPDNAVVEAQQDIQRGTMKIYRHGTIASQAVGVEPEQMPLIQSFPTEDAGIGCIVNDWDLRRLQGEYARRYNQAIVQHLQRQPR